MTKSNRPTGSSGHLSESVRDRIFAAWRNNRSQHGIISRLAAEFGVSHVAISNMILKRTGFRPSVAAYKDRI